MADNSQDDPFSVIHQMNAQRAANRAEKEDLSILKVAGSGLIGAAVAKFLFGNRGS